MTEDIKHISEIVRNLREDRDLYQKDVAKALGMTQQQYSNYENGSSEFSAHYIVILAKFFNVSADYLLGLSDCKHKPEALQQPIIPGCTAEHLLDMILSLSKCGRQNAVELIKMIKIKEKYSH